MILKAINLVPVVHSVQNSVFVILGKSGILTLKLQNLALTVNISFGFPQVPACSGQSRTDHLHWALPGRGRGWVCGDHQPHCPLLQVRALGLWGRQEDSELSELGDSVCSRTENQSWFSVGGEMSPGLVEMGH